MLTSNIAYSFPLKKGSEIYFLSYRRQFFILCHSRRALDHITNQGFQLKAQATYELLTRSLMNSSSYRTSKFAKSANVCIKSYQE